MTNPQAHRSTPEICGGGRDGAWVELVRARPRGDRCASPKLIHFRDPDRPEARAASRGDHRDQVHSGMDALLVIHKIYNGYWFWGRPSFAELWHDLRAVNREIRPDWDLGTPGLRDAWDAGDLSPFHGWNRRAAARSSAA
jgi:hypothetical protein